MMLKSCVYKGCENYVLDGTASGTFTLFAFPKDKQRRKQWMELGCVADNLPQACYIMCSDHFEKKYISSNNRRAILIGPAKPVAYCDKYLKKDELHTEQTEDLCNYVIVNMDNEANEIVHLNIDSGEEKGQQEQLQESTTATRNIKAIPCFSEVTSTASSVKHQMPNTPENSNVTNLQGSHAFDVIKVEVLSDTKKTAPHNAATWKVTNKRAAPTKQSALIMNADCNLESESKRNKSAKSNSSYNGMPVAFESTAELDQNRIVKENLIDETEVTTFIFKNSEYVQMPKEYYLQEKFELLNKLLRYETKLRNISGQLNEFLSSLN